MTPKKLMTAYREIGYTGKSTINPIFSLPILNQKSWGKLTFKILPQQFDFFIPIYFTANWLQQSQQQPKFQNQKWGRPTSKFSVLLFPVFQKFRKSMPIHPIIWQLFPSFTVNWLQQSQQQSKFRNRKWGRSTSKFSCDAKA